MSSRGGSLRSSLSLACIGTEGILCLCCLIQLLSVVRCRRSRQRGTVRQLVAKILLPGEGEGAAPLTAAAGVVAETADVIEMVSGVVGGGWSIL